MSQISPTHSFFSLLLAWVSSDQDSQVKKAEVEAIAKAVK